MKQYITLVILLILAMQTVSAQVPENHYFIVPGTMSHRLDGSVSPPLSHRDTLVRGTYYGSDIGGAMTGEYKRVPFNSSQYKDFSFFWHPSNPNWITDPNQVNILPKTGNNGYNQGNNKWLFNFRIAYPSTTHYTYDTASKEKLFPMIIFMHGAGERGDCWGSNCYGESDPRMWNNDHNLSHGGAAHAEAINRDPSHSQHWPGFVVFPQNKNGWNTGTGLGGYTARVIALVEHLIKVYPVDPNRVYIHGLSEGAQGTWMLINTRPDLFAASAAISGSRENTVYNSLAVSMDTTMIHLPHWQFQGGEDNRPRPSTTEGKMKKLTNLGGTPRYTLYPEAGHSIWARAYREPDFFSWFLQYSKLTIHGYYGVKSVCEGDEVNVRLGISKGFDDYEWRKVKGGVITPMPPSPERPNEIIADELASYQVRFLRDGEWTEWSEPYTITSKPRPSTEIKALGSTALPGLDGKTEVTIATDQSGIYYEWYKNGTLYMQDSTLTQITVSDPGAYSLVLKDEGLCKSTESNKIYVSTKPYVGSLPAKPENLYASTSSPNSINIYWEDKSNDELGFEIYRSLDGTNYEWVTTTEPNILMYSDASLTSNTLYYYKVRAYNINGASPESNVASARTSADDTNPSVPADFTFKHFNYTEHRLNTDGNNLADEHFTVHTDQVVLSWKPSTDNVGVKEYRIYFSDGTLAKTTTDTQTVVTGLQKGVTYGFYVVAVDAAGNSSSPSNNISVTTVFEGLYFNLYGGGTWDFVKDFSDWSIITTGTVSNFKLGAKGNHYVDDDYFAFDFFGYIHITTEGTYTFYTKSDDGSQLWIGNQMIVNNDGLHGFVEARGDITLSKGVYPITVKYFERSGGQGLEVRYQGPGISKKLIPDIALKSGEKPSVAVPSVPSNLTATADDTEFRIDLSWDYSPVDIVVLGSSTAAGTGASIPEKGWVNRLDSALYAQNADYTLTNLAKGGFNTYHTRATGESGGGFSGAPDPARNITAALALNPDIIIVNLPSNNVADGIPIETTIAHYNELKSLAEAQNVKIFFTTTQPRDFGSNSTNRHLLEDEANAVKNTFGQQVIDLYAELTDFSNDNRIKSKYSAGDGIHLNDAGHYYVFNQSWKKVGPYIPKFEVYRATGGGPFELIHTTKYMETSFQNSGLAPNQNYSYKLKATNINGSSAFSSTVTAKTAADVVPPTVPENLHLRSKTATKVALSWDHSQDNVGVSHYLVTYSEGTSSGARTSAKVQSQTATSTTNGITITDLEPETQYTFTVSAIDASSNSSGDSDPLTVTTASDDPLPVDFVSFTYKVDGKDVILNWTTSNEINNDYFAIERAENTDEYTVIGKTDGAGTTDERSDYEFRDTNPLDVAYYRIKQVDFDGKSSYSKVIRVTFSNIFEDLVVYPNPTSPNNINIKGNVPTQKDRININFFDAMGKSYLVIDTDPNALLDGLTIDPKNNLHPGVYIVVISDGTNKSQKRLIIR